MQRGQGRRCHAHRLLGGHDARRPRHSLYFIAPLYGEARRHRSRRAPPEGDVGCGSGVTYSLAAERQACDVADAEPEAAHVEGYLRPSSSTAAAHLSAKWMIICSRHFLR